jgi:hypothetical protein
MKPMMFVRTAQHGHNMYDKWHWVFHQLLMNIDSTCGRTLRHPFANVRPDEEFINVPDHFRKAVFAFAMAVMPSLHSTCKVQQTRPPIIYLQVPPQVLPPQTFELWVDALPKSFERVRFETYTQPTLSNAWGFGRRCAPSHGNPILPQPHLTRPKFMTRSAIAG